MINKNFENTFDFIDVDTKLLLSILKRYKFHLTIFVTMITLIVLLFTLNLDKKYRSVAKIVIEQDNKNIVNIEEYSSINLSNNNRINNQIAIFKSDQVLEYVIKDKKNSQKFKSFFLENNQNFIQKIFKKKKTFNMASLKSILSSNLEISKINKTSCD